MPTDNEIVDFHTHAFPDALAEHAIHKLESETDNAKAFLDGRLSSLLGSMDRAGIRRAVVCSIATKPRQFRGILNWSVSIASDRIVPFPSVHPADPDAVGNVSRVRDAGFLGVKLHPYYQNFDLDDPESLAVCRRLAAERLILVCHTGFDIAFPRIRKADPRRIVKLLEAAPELKLVTTHLGSWQDWDEVERLLLGQPLYMEISYSIPLLGRERARALLDAHSPEYLLFGTDSPWCDQTAAVADLRSLDLGADKERAVFGENARRLLGLHGETGAAANAAAQSRDGAGVRK